MMEKSAFLRDLEVVINRYSMENQSNTPDFILAMYLENCLHTWNEATQQRETWYGRDPRPTMSVTQSNDAVMDIFERG